MQFTTIPHCINKKKKHTILGAFHCHISKGYDDNDDDDDDDDDDHDHEGEDIWQVLNSDSFLIMKIIN